MQTNNNQSPLDILKQGLREFSLSSFAVDNATSIFLLTFMILLFGVQSYNNMPKEQYPEAVFPTVYISTPYPGNSAADIESLVTRPIEKELQGIQGLNNVQSSSVQDFSSIRAEFETGFDTEEVVRKVKDAVDKAKADLPTDLPTDPEVSDINLSDLPIMTINMSGDFTMDQLREYGEYLQDKIEEDVDEVNEAVLKGAMEREVKVDVDLSKAEARQVSFNDIAQAIQTENLNMSGGEVVNDNYRRALRVVGEFENIREMEEMIVKSEGNNPIYLRDIAKVNFGYKDATSIARSDGLPVVSLDIIKRRGENLLSASDKVKEVVAEAERERFPEQLKVSVFNDQSINTRNQVSNLENSIISGVILVVLVLLFFLGLRNASFVGLAIPLSMLMGIMILYALDVTMNIVVLFSLILALGLLVDNAIVVVENIYRYMQNGYGGEEAAKYGVGEVAMPIIASTATTLAAFIPLAFWPGIMGEFMKYMPITLIIVLASSLFVALVINPVFTSRLMKVDERAETANERSRKMRNILIMAGILFLVAVAGHLTGTMWLRNLMGISFGLVLVNFFLLRPASFAFQNSFLPLLEKGYDRFIRGVLHRFWPGVTFLGTFALLFIAIQLLTIFPPRVEFFPSADPIYINVFVELPIGKDIKATNEVTREMERRIEEVIKSNRGIVEEVLTQIGENTSDPNGEREPGVTPNKARISVSFVPTEERGGVSTKKIMEDMRNNMAGIPGVQISIDKNADGPAVGKPINIEIRGDNIDELAVLTEEVKAYLNSQNVGGVEELQTAVKIGKPELVINIDREAARRYGVSTFAIADAIRTAVYGKEVSKYKVGEDEYDIFVRLDEKYRNDINDLINQDVIFRDPTNGRIVQVPISAVANTEYTSTYSSIKRKDLSRMNILYSNVTEGYNANEVVDELKGLMAEYQMPTGYVYEFTGEQEQQAKDMAFLNTAFALALFSIFLIIVAQFNSLVSPFIIILSVLFSTIGVFLGYVITGRDISVIFTGVGIISLAGVVVNNAIVLIDYINLLIKRKMDETGKSDMFALAKSEVKEAIIRGGATRLRPVLLTAITTVLGLIPLAIGLNINFFTIITDLNPNYFIGGDNTAIWGPMAWTVIYGLVFATFLTLVVVPVMFWLAFLMNRGLRKIFSSSGAATAKGMDLEPAE